MSEVSLVDKERLLVRQVREIGEWFGFETRNKYQIMDSNQVSIAFAAEQQKGLFGFLFRQWLGHWRRFDVHFFTADRQLWMVAHHPFRWFFERLEVRSANGKVLGALQKRFALLHKRFDLEDAQGQVLLEVSSPIWRIWTFVFRRQNREVATLSKKWSGILSEVFTDRDNFSLEFQDRSLGAEERQLLLASAVFVDLLYFEKKK